MNDQLVSREALLRSLDSLEQICSKRINKVRLIDDEQLSTLILSIQTALYVYADQHAIPALALTATKFPPNVVLPEIPFVVEVIYYAFISLFLLGCVFGLAPFLWIFVPVVAVIVIAHAVIAMIFSNNRRTKLMQISSVVDEAGEMLSNN